MSNNTLVATAAQTETLGWPPAKQLENLRNCRLVVQSHSEEICEYPNVPKVPNVHKVKYRFFTAIKSERRDFKLKTQPRTYTLKVASKLPKLQN